MTPDDTTPAEAIAALEQAILRRYPKADLLHRGVGFNWADFVNAFLDAWPLITAGAAAAERERILEALFELHTDATTHGGWMPGWHKFADLLAAPTGEDTA